MSATRYRVRDRGSRSVRILEHAWRELRRIIPGLPHVVITLMNSPLKMNLGYVHANQWRYIHGKSPKPELAISPQLFDSPQSVLGVLIHEAGHALLLETPSRGGTGSDHYYHLKEFRDVVRKLGLCCEFANARYGWTNTGWPKTGIPKQYAPILAILKRLPTGTGTYCIRTPPRRPLPDTGHVRLVCRCRSKRSIYVSKAVAKDGGIACRLCRAVFRPILN